MEYIIKNITDLKNLIFITNEEYSTLSPFTIDALSTPKNTLFNKYGKNNALNSDLLDSLNVLKSPDSFIDVNYVSNASQLSYSIFNKDNSLISILYSEDEITLNTPADYVDIFAGMQSFTGYSTVKSIDLNKTLSLNETIIILACIDLQRHDLLIAHGQHNSLCKKSFNVNNLKEYLKKQNYTQHDLIYYFQDLISSKEDYENDFNNLIEKKLLKIYDNGYQLNEKLFYLAANCLLINNFIHTKNVLNNNNRAVLMESFTLQYGIEELIQFSFNKDKATIQTLSSCGLYAWMESIIENQETLIQKMKSTKTAKRNEESTSATNDGGYCPNCGSFYDKYPNFCGKCGHKLT